MAENVKSRYWAFIIWPDSTPDWKEKLIDLHIPCAISPLHNADIDETGEGKKPKKEHYHCLLQYGNTTTYKHINKIITDVISTQAVQPVNSARGYFRYLIHADNPEKVQYSQDDITYLNGFDANEVLSDGDIDRLIDIISDICIVNKFNSYRALYSYLRENGLREYCRVVSHHTIHFKALCYIPKEKVDTSKE